ncbi:MAG: GNAT family N-acetyltransferase [Acidobacteriota bacterium]|nr:GNAT family N-acetyltransferase [Acidobacteriota bacterium]
MLTPETKRFVTSMRPYRSRDREAVFRLLSFLPSLYPKGAEWLDGRLEDVLRGRARCTLAFADVRLAGVTIETPKGKYTTKLSTIWVAPEHRASGIGTALLDACRRGWERSGVRSAYVTADVRAGQALWPVLKGLSFRPTNVEKDRYGEGRDETVFHWSLG